MLIEKLGRIFNKEPDPTAIVLRDYLDSAGYKNTVDRQIDFFGQTARVRTLVERNRDLLERSEVIRVSKTGDIETIFEGHFLPDYHDWGTVSFMGRSLNLTLALC